MTDKQETKLVGLTLVELEKELQKLQREAKHNPDLQKLRNASLALYEQLVTAQET